MAQGTDTYLAIEYVLDEVADKFHDDRSQALLDDPNQDFETALLLITNGIARDENSSARKYSNEQLYNTLSYTFDQRLVVGMGSEIGEDQSQISQIAGYNADEDRRTYWTVDSIACEDP